MIDPHPRPSSVPCGRCRASTALEWAYAEDGCWLGMGHCSICGSGVFSICSESGLRPGDLADLLLTLHEASGEGWGESERAPNDACSLK